MGVPVSISCLCIQNTGMTRAAYAHLHVEYAPAVSFCLFARVRGRLLASDQVDANTNADGWLRTLVHFFAQL